MLVRRKQTSWVLIVLCFFLFWPLGVVLLVKRLAVDRSATMTCGSPLIGLAYVLTGVGAVYLIFSVYREPALSVHAALLVVGGLWLTVHAYTTKATANRYKRYIDLVVNKSHTSIDYIASVVGVTYARALSDLKRMVDAGYFPGAYVSVPAKKIFLPGSTPVIEPQPAPKTAEYSQISQPHQPTVVSCKGCGANNRILPGQIVECEYCGTPLQHNEGNSGLWTARE